MNEQQKAQQERWEEWRRYDFDRLITLYTRVRDEFSVAHFTLKDMSRQNELTMDSSFLLEQLRERYYLRHKI